MGYTNYWTFKGINNVDSKDITSMKQSIGSFVQYAMDNGYALANGKGDVGSVPTLDTEIIFNGIADQSHETFYIPETLSDGFNFTKTARKEYDAVVVGCMLCMKVALPDHVKLSSDGVCYYQGKLEVDDEVFAGIALWYKYLSQILTYSKSDFYVQALMLFDGIENVSTGKAVTMAVDNHIYG
jgi:hypothetical protein